MGTVRNILALTPIASGRLLAPYTLGLPRVVSELAPLPGVLREVNININRARLQGFFRRLYWDKFDYVLLLDSDVIVGEEIVERLLGSWKIGSAPCVRTKEKEGGHVVAACCLLHKLDYDKISYMEKPNICQCRKIPNTFYVDGVRGCEL